MRGMITVPVLAVLAFGPLGSGCGSVSSARAAPASDDPAMPVFQALSEVDRRAVQDALIWTGDYSGVVTGGYGPRTRDAIVAYAGKHGLKPAEALGAGPRRALMATAQALRKSVGFLPVKDKRTAFVLSLPTSLLGKATATTTGTRYTSPDGAIVVDTLSRPAGEDGLKDAFTRMSTTSPQRKITYKLLKDDFFVVTGEVGERKFYSRFASGTAGEASLVRGFTLTYAKDASARLDPITLAVAASFDPFPGSPPPGMPAAEGASTVAGTPVTGTPAAQKPPVPAGADAQAVMVAPGVALTVLTSRNCPNPSLDKVAAKFRAEDAASGLALLDVSGRSASAVALADGAMADGSPVVALFNGRSGGLYAAPGEAHRPGANGFAVTAPLQADSRGTPIFDRSGALVGVTAASKSPPAIAGTLLQADYRVSGSAPIAKLLDQAGVAHPAPIAGAAMSFGDIVMSRGLLVGTVSCVK